jgi:hypothetical protein
MLRWSWWPVLAAGLFLVSVGPRFVLKDGSPEQVRGRRRLVRASGVLMLVCGIGALLLSLLE